MHSFSKFFRRFAWDESGGPAIEYGLVAALIAGGLLTALTTIGSGLKLTFTNISASLGSS